MKIFLVVEWGGMADCEPVKFGVYDTQEEADRVVAEDVSGDRRSYFVLSLNGPIQYR